MTRRNARDRPHDGDPHIRSIGDDRARRFSKVRDAQILEILEIGFDDRRAGARRNRQQTVSFRQLASLALGGALLKATPSGRPSAGLDRSVAESARICVSAPGGMSLHVSPGGTRRVRSPCILAIPLRGYLR